MRKDVTIECSLWKDEAVLVLEPRDDDEQGSGLRLMIDLSYALTRENIALLLAILEGQDRQSSSKKQASASQLNELSLTELRVLRYLPTNLSRPDIARELYVSLNTVCTHIRNIYSKLDAKTRAEAVDRGRQLDLLAG
jgi:ATP/maltotriose-dependent transcriptional regulator MalT